MPSVPPLSQNAATLGGLGMVSDRRAATAERPASIATAVRRPRVALIGAGRIADTHAQALKEIGTVDLAAIIDPVPGRAAELARKWGFAAAFDDLDAALAAGIADVAHVLVPPPLHRAVTERCLAAGLDVLLEKPMAETDADCAALQDAARAAGRALHVNQNFVHHPAQIELKRIADAGTLGRLRHVACQFNMPLAQMQARQFGHWMFAEPRNLLLEQAVHPLSQIDDLVGPVVDFSVTAPPPRIVDGLALHTTWLVSMVCERGTAELFVSWGQTHPAWLITAIFDDGTVTADCVRNRVMRQGASRWMDPIDFYGSGASAAAQSFRQANRNMADYALSMFKLKPRSDPFYRSMRASIAAFHEALAKGEQLDGDQGRRLVALCGAIADKVGAKPAAPAPAPSPPVGTYDVLVIGGTGFIGRPLVAALLKQGKRVAVLARNSANLPPLFRDPDVAMIRGSATNPADLAAAMAGVTAVVNLAHAGGAATWPEVERAIVGGARTVAEECLARDIERLIHVSTIAAIDLGDRNAIVTGETPPDPNAERRPSYSRAKAMAEHKMLRMHREQKLPVTILRPGVVVGEGSSPFHSGIGFYNREQHCLGWNAGDNPLPLVLAEDTAAAILLALETPAAVGRTYNVVGDVRLTAREYTAALAKALKRPLRYHPQGLVRQQAIEIAKWLVKRVTGRSDAPPSLADLKSRGLAARFDTGDIKRDLGWQPVADRADFIRRAIDVHGDG